MYSFSFRYVYRSIRYILFHMVQIWFHNTKHCSRLYGSRKCGRLDIVISLKARIFLRSNKRVGKSLFLVEHIQSGSVSRRIPPASHTFVIARLFCWDYRYFLLEIRLNNVASLTHLLEILKLSRQSRNFWNYFYWHNTKMLLMRPGRARLASTAILFKLVGLASSGVCLERVSPANGKNITRNESGINCFISVINIDNDITVTST